MKISLFTKSSIIKACSLFMLVSITVGTPIQADAGFFSGINDLVASVIGKEIQASEPEGDDFGTDNFSNSQNMQVLGTDSVDPDIKNIGGGDDFGIDDGALLPDSRLIGSGLESFSSGSMAVYEVKDGDTLSEIAELHDVSVNTIKWENNIAGQNIKAGQKLNILPVTGVKHTIKKGDTIDKIAAKYDAEVEDITVFNDISSSTSLKQGDVLYVPNGIIKTVVVAQKPTVKKGTTSVSSSSNTRAASGYYLRPASGRITSPYGPRKSGYHYGIDIGNVRGTTVVAAAPGVVTNVLGSCVEGRSSCGGRYGNYVVISHPNGTTTRYAHLSRTKVSVGDSVSQGEQIGTIGNTGRSTGPHLHFEIENANGSKMKPQF